MARYELKLLFDWRSSGSLWAMNTTGFRDFGSGPVDSVLPISERTRARLGMLSEKHDGAMNWDDPKGPSPWTAADFDAFEILVADIWWQVTEELGPEFSVTYDRLGEYEPPPRPKGLRRALQALLGRHQSQLPPLHAHEIMAQIAEFRDLVLKRLDANIPAIRTVFETLFETASAVDPRAVHIELFDQLGDFIFYSPNFEIRVYAVELDDPFDDEPPHVQQANKALEGLGVLLSDEEVERFLIRETHAERKQALSDIQPISHSLVVWRLIMPLVTEAVSVARGDHPLKVTIAFHDYTYPREV